MKPSETPRGKAWLAQFEIDDVDVATLLLNSVRIVSSGGVAGGVRRALERMLIDPSQRTPIAAIPILSLEDLRPLSSGNLSPTPVAFEDFDPSQNLAGEPGSEALVSNVIREIRNGAEYSANLGSFPVTIASLRAERVRTLLFLTDYIGSGRQVLRYVGAWHRNPTIKSWRSYGLLDIKVVTFAATAAGLKSVRSSPLVDLVEVVEMVPTLGSEPVPHTSVKVEELCMLYARRGKLKGEALGFSKSGGLYASSFSVPNNLPAILIRRSKQWTPFFDGRSAPSELVDQVGDFRPDIDIVRELSKARNTRLAARFAAGDINKRWQDFVAMLALLPKSDEEVAQAIGFTVLRVREIRSTLVELKLAGDDGQPTISGAQVIARARQKRRLASAGLQHDDSPYYPRHMR